ncbi:chitobiase/beta-hexosaminidase C-terminal domain-containing protein [Treponema sp. OMZ 792]|uniref:chitobiase/beta-hexosaminidase C-terminal domain-containing protein n=1 Tax=unclassified Treponema TaxID=2638727 RepID=UPI0020A4CDCE|nr:MULTISPECIES: chitobiase/beta-hexosaminidase C-terminal domain-containing protein [unclassified Treponema]UTC75982.1 chitobiase/beta-hexosaminidase C-terminal domain-containing protein [Treponema sp. OMZ 792]UTC79983.1 hypothetical protein E4O07_04555 [Treponema sp. OMZ 798]
MKLYFVKVCSLVALLFIGCKLENHDAINASIGMENTENLSLPEITVSYKTAPSEVKTYCNELLEAGWGCDIYRLDELGTGTIVSFSCADSDVSFYYTLDGTVPTKQSLKYTNPFEIITISEIRVKAFKDNASSKVSSLKINTPYGKTQSEFKTLFAGDGLAGIYIIYEALDDHSGPNFLKQHFILDLDDGNRLSGDGIPGEGIITFDSYNQNNFMDMIGTTDIFQNNIFESQGNWKGTLWTGDLYKIDCMSDNYHKCICCSVGG